MPDIVVAPMAGGPSTPALVIAAARAGAIGYLAAGYKTPAAVEGELRAVQGRPYGLNIFVPTPPPPDLAAVERYRALLQPEYDRYRVDPPAIRPADDDHFAAKVELAVAYRVPEVSFTFGVPGPGIVAALRPHSRVLVTVTDADEARRALAAGADALIAQGGTAGGHSATIAPGRYTGDSTAFDVLAAVRAVTDRPVLAAGGGDVPGLLRAGAAAVQCGTAFLPADEAGTRPAHRDALLAGGRDTVVTRAFTGQPARALRNRFTDTYSAAAPVGYPAVHHLTTPIRAAGDVEALNLWAGRDSVVRPGTAAAILDWLRDTGMTQRSHRNSTHS